MDSKYWTYIEKVKAYLDSKKAVGIEGMKRLFTQKLLEDADFVVITFTYEKLEVFVQKEGHWQINQDLSESLNRYEIEDITNVECENEYEDFQFSQITSITSELIKSWIVDCFYSGGGAAITTKCYFKEQHDQLEILELNTLESFYEETELKTFINNSQHRQIRLIPS